MFEIHSLKIKAFFSGDLPVNSTQHRLNPIPENRAWKHSGRPCRLAAGNCPSVHARDLRSWHLSTDWSSSLIQSQTATAISSQLSTALAFPLLLALFPFQHPHQIIWNIASAESRPKKKPRWSPPDFSFRGKQEETRGAEAIFASCRSSHFESSLVWLIFPPVLQSSLVIPLQHFGHAPHKWQMCSHGNRPVVPLSPLACQMKSSSAREEPAGDLTDLTSVQQGDFWQSSRF